MTRFASDSRGAHGIYSPCCPFPEAHGVVACDGAGYNVATFVLAGGVGARLGTLTAERPKPVLPFAGHHRLIDFTLSNAANSGLSNVGILTQYMAPAITAYVRDGTPWGYGTAEAALRVLPSSVVRPYAGTADAVRQHLATTSYAAAETVLVLAADHVYRMDYQCLLDDHFRSGADVTIGVVDVPLEDAGRFGVVETDAHGRILQFEEKPAEPKSTLASMGIYAFKAQRLRQLLDIDASDVGSDHDFGRDVLPLAIRRELRVHAYQFDGFWRDVGTPESYWETHRDVLRATAGIGLDSVLNPLCSGGPTMQRIDFGPEARAQASVVFGGCSVHGSVEGSLLSPGVHVGRDAIVRDSVLLAGARVEQGAVVEHAILDEHSTVGRYAVVGRGHRSHLADISALHDGQVTVVGARARVQPGQFLARGTVIPAVLRQQYPATTGPERQSAFVA